MILPVKPFPILHPLLVFLGKPIKFLHFGPKLGVAVALAVLAFRYVYIHALKLLWEMRWNNRGKISPEHSSFSSEPIDSLLGLQESG